MSLSISSPDFMLSNLSIDNVESPSSSSRLEHLYNLRSVPPINQFYVVKMRNIPWEISADEIVSFFYPLKIPFGHVAPHYCHGIHIPMQSSTGKTISECFVELENANDANEAIKLRKFVKGRLISVVQASQQELMDRLFPGIQLHDNESFELIPGLSIENNQTCTFLSQEEINGILIVCKRFKLHFSRKCAERPFELVISILSKMPWHQTNRISLLQRDHLFEMFKIATESLVFHLAKSAKRYLENTLLIRLIRAGLTVPLFTEKQKLTVLSVSNLSCPKDLETFVFNPPEEESDISPKSEKMNIFSSPVSISSIANVNDRSKVSVPFQTPIGFPGKFKGNYSSLFETHGSSRINQGLPSPASSIRIDTNESSPWKTANGRFSPFSSNGSIMKEVINDQTSKISDLEKKLDEYRKKLKNAGVEISSKQAALSDLNERHVKLRDQLRSCLSFIKSLQRRNDELEYFHFKSKKSSWGMDGLHMEYSSWKDMNF